MQPKVSVCLITYNQEKFIHQALDGIIAQKLNHSFEVIVSDDYSQDNTAKIIQEYAVRYPYMKVLKSDGNIGMHRNWEKAIKACTGQYVALLEGDDFWTDELKLQKQVDILEDNSQAASCCTNANVINEVNEIDYPRYITVPQPFFDMNDLLKANSIPTCSVMFRNHLFNEFPPTYFKSPYADWIIHILNTLHGYMHFLDEKTCTYRLHPGGVFGNTNQQRRLERTVKAYDCICDILAGDKWQATAVKYRKDAKYKLRQHYLAQKQYALYVKSIFI